MTPPGRGHAAQRISPTGLAIVIALHGAVLFALLQMNAIRLPAELPVLTVDLLMPPAPELPGPAIVPPRPRPVEKRPVPRPVPRPVQQPAPLALPAEAPAAASAIDIPAVPPAPTFAQSAPLAPPAPPVAASKPRFDADYLDNPKPGYPPLSRRMREEGRVVLRVRVAANGLPTEVVLHAGSGSERLDRAALETVRRWKFMPARIGDEAVAASVLVPIVFSLKD